MSQLIKQNVNLAPYTTFGIGGPASYFTQPKNLSQLRQVLQFSQQKELPHYIIGGGSNLLFPSQGLNALVIKLANQGLNIKKDGSQHALITAQAGTDWDDLVATAVQHQLQGIECLSGIPGSVGASPIQNIGAYGQELKDTFFSLTALDTQTDQVTTFSPAQCQFAYRHSIFKQKSHRQRYIILQITLRLTYHQPPTITYQSLIDYLQKKQLTQPSLSQVRQAVLEIRQQKLEDPQKNGNAGSFFKNPSLNQQQLARIQKKYPHIPYFQNDSGNYKVYAGWLIEKAGFKGKKHQTAAVSSKNALVLINPQHQSNSKDIKQLANLISKKVKQKFNIQLEPEVRQPE